MITHSEKNSDTSRQSSLQRCFLSLWYRSPLNKHVLSYALLPLSFALSGIATLRRYLQAGKTDALAVPVMVVGNLSVGGTGKTPVVIALVKALHEKGIKAGVVSRGYGSQAPYYPYTISADTPVEESGDEALLIAQSLRCPVVLDRDRLAAAQYLIKNHPNVQIIISDDGLQHYRLPRQLEVVVVDGERGFGNGLCLPSGPLREKASRLASVNWVLINGQLQHDSLTGALLKKNHAQMPRQDIIHLQPMQWRNIKTGQVLSLETLPWHLTGSHFKKSHLTETHLTDSRLSEINTNITAVAAIGNPERFFNTVRALAPQEEIKTIAFNDHYTYSKSDFDKISDKTTVLMTAKDAVKCQAFAKDNWWSLDVSVSLPSRLLDSAVKLIH